MRRITTSLGTLAAGALLALVLPAAGAHAADGVLMVDGMPRTNPQGCVEENDLPGSMVVDNLTDRFVLIHLLPNCQGQVTAMLQPGETEMAIGSSVAVLG